MPRLAWGGAGAHSLGVGGRLVETDARTLHLLAYSDLTWMDLLRAALIARSIPEITLSPSKNYGWAARRCSTRASPLRPSPLRAIPTLQASKSGRRLHCAQHRIIGQRDCMAFSICSLTASRLKLAPFCIGGKSIAVWASLATSCCTSTKRQNSNPHQLAAKTDCL